MPKGASDALVALLILFCWIAVPYALTYGLLYATATVSLTHLLPVPD